MSTDGTTSNHLGGEVYPGNEATSDLASQVKSDVSALADVAREDAVSVGKELGHELNQLKDQAGGQLNDLRHEAERQIGATVEKAKGFAGEQKDVVAQQLIGVANALGKVAGELETGEQAAIGGYARDISNSIRRFAETVESNDVDQLLGRIEQFGRGQQVAFLAIAGLAGLAASRFLMASAERRNAMTTTAYSSTGAGTYQPAGSTGASYTAGDSYGSSMGRSSSPISHSGEDE